jgi:hypothetical protein
MPFFSSSRMRSAMMTLASMAMPRVRAIPAMPGRVRVACIMDSRATSRNMLVARASTEMMPNNW